MKRDTSRPLRGLVHQALRKWNQPSDIELALFNLSIFKDKEGKATKTSGRRAAYRKLEELILILGEQQPEQAELLLHRFMRGQSMKQVGGKLHLSVDHLNRLQREAIGRLTEVLEEAEAQKLSEVQERVLVKLPPASYSQLFGRKALIEEICKLLRDPDGPLLIELVGIGGLGKTTLAHSVATQMAEAGHIEDVTWIRAEHSDSGFDLLEKLSRLISGPADPTYLSLVQIRKKLKASFQLIVLDNLSWQLEDLAWLEQLASLCRPTRFILTSRLLPTDLATVYAIRVTELSPAEASNIAVQQARLLGIGQENVDALPLDELYKLTGGNPLAIKLSIGLTRLLPVNTVLDSLTKETAGKTEELFDHIYAATWETLQRSERVLLVSTLAFAEDGARLDQLQAAAELNEREATDAALNLTRLSLIELRRGNRYGIHRLTRSFLESKHPRKGGLREYQMRNTLAYWQIQLRNLGARALLTREHENLLHALAASLSGGDSNSAASLIALLYPAVRTEWNLNKWLDVYDIAGGVPLDSQLRAQILFQSGSLWLRSGVPSKAKDSLARVIELPNADLKFQIQLANAAILLTERKVNAARKAIVNLQKGVSAEKRLACVWALGIINYQNMEYRAADKKFSAALKKLSLASPIVAARLRVLRGLCLLALSDLRGALKQLRMAAEALTGKDELVIELAQVDLLRSFVFYRMNDLVNAEAALVAARDRIAGSEHSLQQAFLETSIGRIRLVNKKSAEAADFLKSATKLWKKLGQPVLAADAASLLLLATSDDSVAS